MQEKKQTPEKSKAKPGGRPMPKGKPVNKKAMKKKKKRVSFGGVFSIFLILVIGAVVGVLYFDLFDTRQMLSDILELEKPTQAQLDEVNAKISELAIKEEEFSSTVFSLNKRDKEVSEREKELNTKEEQLKKKEEELKTLKTNVESRQKDVKAMAKMFELMTAKKAAEALSKMDNIEDITMLLANMDSEKSAG
jgi:uncharacterized protein HemX